MKDEAKVLPEFLESIYPLLDYYTVVDTGSSDNSIQIIQDFFKAKGIEGQILHHPFVNFEDARNYSLNKSKHSTDFSVIIDPDEKLVFSDDFNLSDLKDQLSDADKGTIQVKSREITYGRMAFYRNSKPFRWQGVVHEVLLCDENVIDKNIKGISIISTSSQSLDQQQIKNKYLYHAQLLHNAIKQKGLEPRNVFYLAQSYKDAGKLKEAIEWYEIRAGIQNGFYEELYYSRLMIAGLKWELQYPLMEVADEYMRCGEFDELRCEHLYFLKQMYEANGRPAAALKIAELLRQYKNPYPQRILFINPKAY